MRLDDYDLLYDLPEGVYDGRGLDRVRTVTWRAGRQLEVACFPIAKLTREARREAKRRRSTPAMAKLNARNTERHIMRLIEENFPAGACVVTGTYAYPADGDYAMMDVKAMAGEYGERGLPWEMERVRMDVRNWLNKLRRRVVKAGGDPSRDFKWLVRVEEGKEPPIPGIPAKFHFHAIVDGPGLDTETVKLLWEDKHGRCHVDPLALNDDGAARLARYFTKQKRGGRWWSHSRNLKIVQPRVSDRKVSRRRLARLAADVLRDGREILEKLYPGYRLAEPPVVHYSDFMAGAYIYARLRARCDTGPQLRGGSADEHAANRRLGPPISQTMRRGD